jgi:transketolase
VASQTPVSAKPFDDIDRRCVDAIRVLSIDAVQNANSGHPGLPLGAAPMAYVLWQRYLRFDPNDPDWADRDRFVLSAGHGSMLLYSLLHLFGYDVSMEQIRDFRQWGSITAGHPEFGMTPGVEATTGPLGQGTANAVGMAVAERMLAHRFGVTDHFTYALVSDGDVMEGIAAEAASLAGHLGLGRLIYLYDSNDVTLDGPARLAMSEDVAARYEAQGWHVQSVEDGDRDLEAIDAAITRAKDETSRPSLIVVKTTLGFGSPNKAGKAAAHGAPLGEEEVALTRETLGWSAPPFEMPSEVLERCREAAARGAALRGEWTTAFTAFEQEQPESAVAWRQALVCELPPGWDDDLPAWEGGSGEQMAPDGPATRVASGKALNAIAARVPWLAGGDADLSSSTKTALANEPSFDGTTGAGRNLHFGVREHAMGSIANGMLYHGGVRPYVSTFFCFSDYMRPSMRLASLSELPAIYVFTHDSVGVGEDGPTHQPVEQLMALRTMPNLLVFRPADANETVAAWRSTMLHRESPVALVLSRQGLPVYAPGGDRTASDVACGAYVLADAPGAKPRVILLATGSEVSVAMQARARLLDEGIACRVVSMPCWELFARQDQAYQDSVLPPEVTARVSVEAGVTLGWERWVGSGGACVGVDRFGASAPGPEVMTRLGIHADAVAGAATRLLR